MEDKHIYRSVLYVPGSKQKALDKVSNLQTDAIIFDLEDAVAPDEKANARQMVCDVLARNDYKYKAVLVRINGLDSEWGEDDLVAVSKSSTDAILIPKVNKSDDLTNAEGLLSQHTDSKSPSLWAMIETTAGILNLKEIVSATPRLRGLVLGTNDLAAELGALDTKDRMPLMTSLSMTLLAARSQGLICIDGVYNAYKDEAGFKVECLQGRNMGFDGKSLIHPAQLDICNDIFSPSDDELDIARNHIEAYEAALRDGRGVAVFNGRIVENLHVESARKLLNKARIISSM